MKIRSGWKVTYYGKSVFAPTDGGGREYPTNVWVHPEKKLRAARRLQPPPSRSKVGGPD